MALTLLRGGEDSLAVGYDCGFESSSGFRDAFAKVFGAPPGRGRTSGCIVTREIASPVGRLVAGATDAGICMLEFADRRGAQRQFEMLRKRLAAAMVPGSNHHVDQLVSELDEYFAGRRKAFDVSLVAPGTPFQQRVWERLRRIPFGQTTSYEQLARDIGHPGAQRAVGRANGDNPIAIVVPCHRVVQKNGELRGYGGGLWRKKFLLDHEKGMLTTKAQRHEEDRNDC